MRLAIALVAVLALTSCTMPGTARPTPTADLTTTAGYRQMLKENGEQINAAIEAMHNVCRWGMINDCTTALGAFETTVLGPERQIRITTPPQGCDVLQAGYVGLMEQVPLYRAQIRAARVTGDRTKVATADDERYRAWSEQWGNDPQSVQRDTCP